jgi:hypothetical protein
VLQRSVELATQSRRGSARASQIPYCSEQTFGAQIRSSGSEERFGHNRKAVDYTPCDTPRIALHDQPEAEIVRRNSDGATAGLSVPDEVGDVRTVLSLDNADAAVLLLRDDVAAAVEYVPHDPGFVLQWIMYMFPTGNYASIREGTRQARSPLMTYVFSFVFWVFFLAIIGSQR